MIEFLNNLFFLISCYFVILRILCFRYVLGVFREYFRTMNRRNLNLESTLEDHGLDFLDSIEISMRIEEDLGYLISAETLPVLTKVRHYVTYINQVERFKDQYAKSPLA